MKKISIIVMATLCMACVAEAQNVAFTSAVGQSVENLLATKLLGDGVYVYNATFNGQAGVIPSRYPQIGTFQNSSFQPIRMESGIILTTGNITAAAGPNNRGDMSAAVVPGNEYIDQQMVTYGITSNPICCATLDFDFVCLSPTISLAYTFASEEYNEFVSTIYNDVFAFLLTGPDPETGEIVTRNIAMIPSTESPEHPDGIAVAINSVNNGTIGSQNQTGEVPEDCYFTFTQYYYDNEFNGTPIPGVQYDGFTQKLSASAMVIPCQSYHMHISVCNVADNGYDSGVMLEGQSFSSPAGQVGLGQLMVDTVVQGNAKVVPLSLAGTNYQSGSLAMYFGGTAVNGVDYMCLDESGQPFNSGDRMSIDQSQHSISIVALQSDLSEPKMLEIYTNLSLCEEFPELITHDTLRYLLTEGSNDPGHDGIDGVKDYRLAVYPNPADKNATVMASSVIREVVLVDEAGRVCNATMTMATENSATIDVSQLAQGVYTLRVVTDEGLMSHPLMVR